MESIEEEGEGREEERERSGTEEGGDGGWGGGPRSSVPLLLCSGACKPEPRTGQAQCGAEGAGQAWAHKAQLSGRVADGTRCAEVAYHRRQEARRQQSGWQ